MHASLSRGRDIDVAISIQIRGDKLRSRTGSAIDRDGIARELRGLAIDLVVVDDQRIVRTRIVAGMATVAFTGQQLRFAVPIEIDQLQCMDLRVGFIDDMPHPKPVRSVALLLKPIEAVAMPLAVDDVGLAIVIYVVAEDGKSGIAQLPVRVPLPFVAIGVDLLEPAVGRQNVRFAVAVHIGDANAVAVLRLPAQMVNVRLEPAKSTLRIPEWL